VELVVLEHEPSLLPAPALFALLLQPALQVAWLQMHQLNNPLKINHLISQFSNAAAGQLAEWAVPQLGSFSDRQDGGQQRTAFKRPMAELLLE
jgi:hypothetical protein